MAMGRSVNMVGIMVILVAALIQSSAAQTTHTVGDTTGWQVPPSADFYSTWASRQNFTVGDSLGHTVGRVPSRTAFDSCTISAAANVISDSPATIPLTTAGEHWFICTVPNHCTGGQKLAITVTGTTTATPPPSGSAMPPPSGTVSPPPPPPNGSGPSLAAAALPVTLLSIAMALFY